MQFQNRYQAGKVLAKKLHCYANQPDTLVLALPRGGVPVGFEVAKALNLPLDVFLVRKLGVPGYPELAMGAIATGGTRILDEDIVHGFAVSDFHIDRITLEEKRQLERNERLYRQSYPMLPITGRHVILVDDGLATGSSMKVAVLAVRKHRPAYITVAAPVADPYICDRLCGYVNELVCVDTPTPFQAVGRWYRNFAQTSDDEVQDLLWQSRQFSYEMSVSYQ